MGTDPNVRRDEGVPRLRLSRLAWVPIPVLLAAMGAFWAAGCQRPYPSAHLLWILNLVFSLLVCLVAGYLIARSFLVRSTPGLLLLGCAVAVWGPAGVVATIAARGDANVSITIYNSCVGVSALCHLAGVSLSRRPRRPLSPPALWLLGGHAHAAGVVALVTLVTLAGWMPAFYVEERGGTLVREIVLISAIAVLTVTAWLLQIPRRRPLSAFAYWYALALLLMAVGLLGVMLQSYHASLLGWTGRATQALGGLYLAVAAVASVRESRVWGLSLEGALTQSIAARRQAEEALRENQALMHAVLEGSPDLIYVKDTAGRMLLANPAACAALGRPAHEVIGNSAREFHRDDPEVGRPILENDRRIMESGRTEALEEPGSNGRTYLSTKAPYRGAEGQVIGLIGISHDITERKQAEEHARREQHETAFANRVLRAFIEHEGGELFERALAVVQEEMASRYGVFGYIAEPGHLICPSLSRMLDACEVEGKCLHYPPEKWKGLWARALQERRSLYTNEAPPVPPGHPIIYNNLAAPILFQGEAIGLLNLANKEGGYREQDRETLDAIAARVAPVLYAWIQRKLRADERQRAEERLRESEERYRGVVQNTSAVIFRVDSQGIIRFANDRALEFFGYSAEELIGRHAVGTVIPERETTGRDLAAMVKEIAADPNRFHSNANENVRKNGERVWMEWTNSGVYDEAGRLREFLAVGIDATERRKAEEALCELNATLERKVAERTAELEHRARQLQKLTLELSQAEERERRRVAVVLHEDLQQQIAGAKFHLGLLHGRSRQESQQDVVQRIDAMLKEAIDKSRRLSHDLSPAVLHMNDLAEVLLWLAEQVWARHGLTVHVDVLGEATLQSESLTQFLFRAAQEVLLNVVKHAGVKEATIRVRRRGPYLCLCISDTGRGFDLRELKDTNGFGLLAIRERVELLGGRMKIRSIQDRGTAVRIVVPEAPESGSA